MGRKRKRDDCDCHEKRHKTDQWVSVKDYLADVLQTICSFNKGIAQIIDEMIGDRAFSVSPVQWNQDPQSDLKYATNFRGNLDATLSESGTLASVPATRDFQQHIWFLNACVGPGKHLFEFQADSGLLVDRFVVLLMNRDTEAIPSDMFDNVSFIQLNSKKAMEIIKIRELTTFTVELNHFRARLGCCVDGIQYHDDWKRLGWETNCTLCFKVSGSCRHAALAMRISNHWQQVTCS